VLGSGPRSFELLPETLVLRVHSTILQSIGTDLGRADVLAVV
jgi:hypothetical protein